MLKTRGKNYKDQFYRKPKKVLEIKKNFFCHILSWPEPPLETYWLSHLGGSTLDSELNSTNIYQTPAM